MAHPDRLKNAFFRVKLNPTSFDMEKWNSDFAYYTACIATGEDLHGKTVVEYRGQEMHVEDIATLFLQASEREADRLFYLSCWPEEAWRRYCKGNRVEALLITVNYVLVGNTSAVLK